jgi:hypothetical protein
MSNISKSSYLELQARKLVPLLQQWPLLGLLQSKGTPFSSHPFQPSPIHSWASTEIGLV